MSGFLYFIPNAKSAPKKALEDAGLWQALGETNIITREIYNGPENAQGVIVMGAGGSAEQCSYNPEKQTWEKVEDKYWVGYYNGSIPTETDLKRKTQLAGHKVELRDGEQWLIPVARMIAGGCQLPQSFVLGANCEIIDSRILTKYAAFWGQVEKMWDNMAQGKDIDVQACFAVAVEALKFNYHISIAEINILGLITSSNFFNGICGAVLDLPSIEEIKKKVETAEK